MKNNRKKYITVALGGTFDHFHDGHKAFIDAAANMGQRLLIGVATKKLTHNKPYPLMIEPLKKRFKSVAHYCRTQGYTVEMIELNDVYGSTIDPDVKMDALFVTTETEKGADKIAVIRDQLKLKKLPVHVIDLVPAEDGKPIHAARIRAGEISRSGRVYANILKNDIILTPKQRQEFAKLQGKIVVEPATKPSKKVVVGDTTLENFLVNHSEHAVGIFDGYCERELYPSELISKLKVSATKNNPAGALTAESSSALAQALEAKTPAYIKINGEEDLLAVAAVLLVPLGCFVYYGQPKQGMAEIEVFERIKEHFYNVLHQ